MTDWEAFARERRAEEFAEEARIVGIIEAALADGDFYHGAAAAIDLRLFHQVPPILYRLWREGRVTRQQLPEAVAEVWIPNPSPVSSLGQRRWLEMFKAAVEEDNGPIVRTVGVWHANTAVAPAFEHLTEPPLEPVEIWRGAALDTGCGMSWTLHRDCALQFAQGHADLHGRPGGLWRAVAPPHAVLALSTDEREQEIVVNPYVVARSRELVSEVPVSAEVERLHQAFAAAAARSSRGTVAR
jgi:hypothetical protein